MKDLKQLTYLSLDGQVTHAGVKELQAALPELKIEGGPDPKAEMPEEPKKSDPAETKKSGEGKKQRMVTMGVIVLISARTEGITE